LAEQRPFKPRVLGSSPRELIERRKEDVSRSLKVLRLDSQAEYQASLPDLICIFIIGYSAANTLPIVVKVRFGKPSLAAVKLRGDGFRFSTIDDWYIRLF
jgi:hypothetical protein